MDRDEQPCLFASDILYMSGHRITLDTLLAHSASPYPLLAYPIPRASKHATANNCPVIPTDASRISDFLYAVLSSSATASVGVLMSRWLQFRRRYRQSCKTINFLFNFFNYFVPLLFVAFPSIYTAKRVLWKTSKPINKEKQNITIARTNRNKNMNWTCDSTGKQSPQY